MKDKKNNEDFINEMKNIDFSMEAKMRESEKIRLMDKVIQIQEDKNMKKSVFSKRGIAAVLSMVVVFSTIAYGGQIIEYIKKQVTLGGYAQYNLYDEEALTLALGNFGEEMAVKSKYSDVEETTMKFYDWEEGISLFAGAVLIPSYVPEGFVLDHVQMYKEEISAVDVNDKYINLVYLNDDDDEIFVMVRYLDEETAFEMELMAEHEEIVIKGHEALVTGRSVHVSTDNVLYAFIFDDTAESVKMIESMFE